VLLVHKYGVMGLEVGMVEFDHEVVLIGSGVGLNDLARQSRIHSMDDLDGVVVVHGSPF